MTGTAPEGLTRLAPDLWVADGPAIRFWGIPFPTRMVVVRLADGGLWLHSPIAHSPALQRAVQALGPIRHLVAPNWVHYAFLPGWQAACPDAATWAAPGVRARAARKGVAIRWDADLDAALPDAWAGTLDQFLAKGHPRHVEAVFFHHPSRTLILTDLLQALDTGPMSWAEALRARILAGTRPGGAMPRLMRLGFALTPGSLNRARDRMLAWSPRRVIFAHGPLPPEGDPPSQAIALRHAFAG